MSKTIAIQPPCVRLNNLYEEIDKDDERSLIVDALASANFTPNEIKHLVLYVKDKTLKLGREDERLRRIEPTYNTKYPADHPGAMKTDVFLLRCCMKSGVSTARYLKERFSPRRRNKDLYERRGIPYPSKVDWSYLSKEGIRQFSFLKPDMFREEARELLNALVEFYSLLASDIALCLQLINQETSIGNSLSRVKSLFYQFISETEDEYEVIKHRLKYDRTDMKENSVYKARMKFNSFEDFVKAMYHKFRPIELKEYLYGVLFGAYLPLDKSNVELSADYAPSESNNLVNALSYQNEVTEALIAEFDSFVPLLSRNKQPTKIKGETLAIFAYSIGATSDVCALSDFHKYFVQKYEGKLKVVGYTAFDEAYNKLDKKTLVNHNTYKSIIDRKEELEKANGAKVVSING